MLMNWHLLETGVGARLSAAETQGWRKKRTLQALLVSLWEPMDIAEQEELVLLTGQRGDRMAEMQVPPVESSGL